ncbi:hypothetical protein F4677DRAFT_418290 [Hypoxylon crocopeplum]|nr:hypothetical protein F4677DRAFT_418290 [Hypoxylon crocopeplum]
MAPVTPEVVVAASHPMPPRYRFVPSGNPYVTRHCREETYAAGQTLYVVHDIKHRRIGIRVPMAVYEIVLQMEDKTRKSRAEAVKKVDNKMETEFRKAIVSQFPKIPEDALPKIISHSMKKYSGRVGRTGEKEVAEKARLAVQAHIRHCHTSYDNLLKGGTDRAKARTRIEGEVRKISMQWGWSPKQDTTIQKHLAKSRRVYKQAKRAKTGSSSVENKHGRRRAAIAAAATIRKKTLAMRAEKA